MIRKANKNDYSEIEGLTQQVQALHVTWRPDIYKPVGCALTQAEFNVLVNDGHILVYEENGHVLGYLSYSVRVICNERMTERRVLYIDTMAVDEAHRRRGIGSALFDSIRAVFKSGGYDGLELQVNAKNVGAREMYRKYGFTEKSVNMELL